MIRINVFKSCWEQRVTGTLLEAWLLQREEWFSWFSTDVWFLRLPANYSDKSNNKKRHHFWVAVSDDISRIKRVYIYIFIYLYFYIYTYITHIFIYIYMQYIMTHIHTWKTIKAPFCPYGFGHFFVRYIFSQIRPSPAAIPLLKGH